MLSSYQEPLRWSLQALVLGGLLLLSRNAPNRSGMQKPIMWIRSAWQECLTFPRRLSRRDALSVHRRPEVGGRAAGLYLGVQRPRIECLKVNGLPGLGRANVILPKSVFSAQERPDALPAISGAGIINVLASWSITQS